MIVGISVRGSDDEKTIGWQDNSIRPRGVARRAIAVLQTVADIVSVDDRFPERAFAVGGDRDRAIGDGYGATQRGERRLAKSQQKRRASYSEGQTTPERAPSVPRQAAEFVKVTGEAGQDVRLVAQE